MEILSELKFDRGGCDRVRRRGFQPRLLIGARLESASTGYLNRARLPGASGGTQNGNLIGT